MPPLPPLWPAEKVVLEAEKLEQLDLLPPSSPVTPEPKMGELVAVAADCEQLPELVKLSDMEPPLTDEDEAPQLLASAICVGNIPGIRGTVTRAITTPIEKANFCMLMISNTTIKAYCKTQRF